jgi:ectoine hydroxylase-related dioxygenase (phytanoyl-CoA dioxygenase family)
VNEHANPATVKSVTVVADVCDRARDENRRFVSMRHARHQVHIGIEFQDQDARMNRVARRGRGQVSVAEWNANTPHVDVSPSA